MNYYTYKTSNVKTGRFYYGVRQCACDPADDTKYWGSSDYLKEERSLDPENWVKDIIRTFPTRAKALEHEKFITKDFRYDELCINRTGGGNGTFGGTGSFEYSTCFKMFSAIPKILNSLQPTQQKVWDSHRVSHNIRLVSILGKARL